MRLLVAAHTTSSAAPKEEDEDQDENEEAEASWPDKPAPSARRPHDQAARQG